MTTQTGAGDESRGGSLVPGATVEATTALVLIGHNPRAEGGGNNGYVQLGVFDVNRDKIDDARKHFAGWDDVHVAVETLAYTRLTDDQIERQR